MPPRKLPRAHEGLSSRIIHKPGLLPEGATVSLPVVLTSQLAGCLLNLTQDTGLKRSHPTQTTYPQQSVVGESKKLTASGQRNHAYFCL